MDKALHPARRRWTIPIALAATLCLALAGPVAAAGPARPFGGYTLPGTEVSGPPVGCPAGALIRYTATADGFFRHLGLVDFTITHCTFVDLETGAGTVEDGLVTMVAANGDTLLMNHHGTFQLTPWPNPTSNNPHLFWVVVGGTGRFADATGSGEASVTSDFVSGVTTSDWWGTISY